MPNQRLPLLDGITPSWADIGVKATPEGANIIDIGDIFSIDTGYSLEVGEQQGASGGIVLSRSTGAQKNEASMTLYYSGFQKMLENLQPLAPLRGDAYALRFVHFGINIQFTPFSLGTPVIYQTQILGCFYAGRKIGAKEGTELQKVDVALNPARIFDVLPNGKKVTLL